MFVSFIFASDNLEKEDKEQREQYPLSRFFSCHFSGQLDKNELRSSSFSRTVN